MFTQRPRHWHSPALALLVVLTVQGSFRAFAQDDEMPTAPAQMPELVPAPALKLRFGVGINDYNNGRVRGAIVVYVYPNSPATRVRVKR